MKTKIPVRQINRILSEYKEMLEVLNGLRYLGIITDSKGMYINKIDEIIKIKDILELEIDKETI